jgi:hypothetical protein
MNKIKNSLSILTANLFLFLATPAKVHAIGDGTLEDVLNTDAGQKITGKLGPVVSAGVNIAFALAGIAAAIVAVWNFVQSKLADNPQDAKSKQKTAMNALIALAICIAGTLLINLILTVFGLNIFQINS